MCSSDVYAHLRIKEKRREERKRKITVIASEKFRRKLSVAFLPSLSRKMITNSFLLFPPSSSTAWGKKSLFGCPIFGFRVSSFPTAILLASAVLSISSWHLFLFGGRGEMEGGELLMLRSYSGIFGEEVGRGLHHQKAAGQA